MSAESPALTALPGGRLERRICVPTIAIAVGLATFVSATREVCAAHLPDWAKEIAKSAPPLPEAVPKETSRVLFKETRVEVEKDGHLKIRQRIATQALSVTAEDIGVGVYVWNDDATVESSRGWHLPPGERAERTYKEDAADVALSNAFMTDDKVHRVRMGGIKRGSIVFFEFAVSEKPRMMSWSVPFYEGVPVLRTRYALETPPGWSVRAAWLRRPGPEPEVSENTRSWVLKDLPGPSDEPLSERASEGTPILVISVAPPSGVTISLPIVPDWSAFDSWYEGVVSGRDVGGPEVSDAAKRALASSGPAPLDQVQAAATFVRDSVRYVDKEIGIGSIQPRPAKETLANLYGDCKDKGTLFRSILGAIGRKSYAVLINTAAAETVSDTVSAFGFNHFIVAVPIQEGEAIPARLAHAVVDAGDLGKLLIVDTTNEHLSIGWISSALAGKKGLVAAGKSSRLVRLPDTDATAHRLERQFRIEVRPDRSLEVTRSTRCYGQIAADARADYRRSTVERRKWLEQLVARTWTEVEVTDYKVEYEAPDGAFVETVSFKVPPLPASGSGSDIPIFPDSGELLSRAPIGKRTTPVVYSYPCAMHLETTVSGAPANAPLPSGYALEGEGWSSRLTAARKDDAINASWDLTFTTRRFSPEAFPQLKKIWASVSTASAARLDLSPGSGE